MPYQPPVEEQRFVLTHVVRVEELAAHHPTADAETVNAVVEALADFAAGEIVPLGPAADRQGARWTPDGVVTADGYRQAYRALVDGGWMSLTGPDAFGGQEMPMVMATVLMEDMCSADMAFSLCPMLSFGAIDALKAHGSDDQKARWLPKLVSGEWTGTMNLTEPQAGSDVGALKTIAVAQPDGRYKIKGQKIFITYGDHDLADNIVHAVLARALDAPAGTKGISLFIVPKRRLNADGNPAERNDVQCASIEHKLGIHGSPTCVMLYGENDDCYGELIGAEGGGMRAMFTMMNAARLQVGLQGVAVAEAATQHAVAYAMERVQSVRAGSPSRESVPIIQHPDVRRMLLRMKALTMGARALVYCAVGMADRANAGVGGAQARVDLLTPLAKAWGTDVGCEVASLGVQVHGGMGYIEETGAARFYRDARIAPIYEGTNGIQAADLVYRKIGLEGGAVLASLLADLRADAAEEAALIDLIQRIEAVVAGYASASIDDRLAGSYPLLTMMAVATAGALLARQLRAAGKGETDFLVMKRTAARYFLDVIVPEAAGLAASATVGAGLLYSCSDGCFAGG
jgi:alkylation response protein AidB-like acyl-CoA dehydrogenase